MTCYYSEVNADLRIYLIVSGVDGFWHEHADAFVDMQDNMDFSHGLCVRGLVVAHWELAPLAKCDGGLDQHVGEMRQWA